MITAIRSIFLVAGLSSPVLAMQVAISGAVAAAYPRSEELTGSVASAGDVLVLSVDGIAVRLELDASTRYTRHGLEIDRERVLQAGQRVRVVHTGGVAEEIAAIGGPYHPFGPADRGGEDPAPDPAELALGGAPRELETKALTSAGVSVSFATHYMSEVTDAGWVDAGDMDGDGDLDIVSGGEFHLYVFENDGTAGGWKRHGDLDSTQMANGTGQLYDVDGDGDLDVVMAKDYGDMGWWESPGGPLTSTPFPFHKIDSSTWYMHDLLGPVDIDRDGKAEEFVANTVSTYWGSLIDIRWYRPGPDPKLPWERHVIEEDRDEWEFGPCGSCAPHSHAGLDDPVDLDGDGDLDLPYSNGWYEGPADPAAAGAAWIWHKVTDIYGISNVFARDMDQDGDRDLLMSAGHHGYGVYWFENTGAPKVAASWIRHDIDTGIMNPEGLACRDFDLDGDRDVLATELDFNGWPSPVHQVHCYENLGGAQAWVESNVAPNQFGHHQIRMVDIDADGLLDWISEDVGNGHVSYAENTSAFLPGAPVPTLFGTVPPSPISYATLVPQGGLYTIQILGQGFYPPLHQSPGAFSLLVLEHAGSHFLLPFTYLSSSELSVTGGGPYTAVVGFLVINFVGGQVYPSETIWTYLKSN